MPKVLVIEKHNMIQALLMQRFSADHISVDAMPLLARAMGMLNTGGYDVLISDAAASKTEQSKGLELLDTSARED